MMTTKGEKAVTSQSAESLIFQTLAEESPHGILVFQDDKVTFANASASLMLGYSLRTISRWTRKKLVSRVTEEDRPKMLWVFSKLAEGRGPPVQSEIRFIQKKGKTRWFHTIGNIVILDDQPTLQINLVDITELKQAETTLQESEGRLQALISAVPDLLFQITSKGVFKSYHAPTESDLYVPPSEFLGKHFGMVMPPDLSRQTMKYIEQALQTKTLQQFEYQLPIGDKLRIFEARLVASGEDEVSAIIREITERKQAEEAIQQAHAEITTIFNTIKDGMRVIDTDFNVIRVNKAFRVLSGMGEEDILGQKCYESLPGSHCHSPTCTLGRILGGEESVELEVDKQSKNSTIIPCSLIATALRSEDGELLGMVQVFRDISESKRTQAELQASRERFRALVEETADWIWEVDAQGNFTYSNNAVEDILGRTAGQMLGLSLFDFIVEEEADAARLQFKENLAAKRGFNGVVNQWVQAWEGQRVFLEACGRPILNEEKEAIGFRGICRDITERIEAYTTLRESEARYRTLVNTSPDAITVTDLDGVILIASQQTMKIHGFEHEGELLGRNALDLIKAEEHPQIKANLQQALEQGICQNLEFTFLRKDSSAFPGKLGVAVLNSADGKPMGFIFVSRDITEIKEAEEDILEARARAEFFNDLMTHDLTNINQAILLALELSLQENELPKPVLKQLQFSIKQVERSAALIAHVKHFLHIDTESPILEPEDIAAAYGEALEAVKQVYPNKSIRVETNIQKGKFIVMADDYLVDLLFHLLSNAVRFDRRERIVVDVEVSLASDKDFIKIEVKDRGLGIPDELKELLFARYTQQVHEKTKGRGISLTLVRSQVTRYKGKIWVEDRVLGDHSHGANFVILLPREKQPDETIHA